MKRTTKSKAVPLRTLYLNAEARMDSHGEMLNRLDQRQQALEVFTRQKIESLMIIKEHAESAALRVGQVIDRLSSIDRVLEANASTHRKEIEAIDKRMRVGFDDLTHSDISIRENCATVDGQITQTLAKETASTSEHLLALAYRIEQVDKSAAVAFASCDKRLSEMPRCPCQRISRFLRNLWNFTPERP